MLKKILLSCSLLLCIILTIYIVQELRLEKIQVDASYYFEEADSIVYVINHPSSVDFVADEIKTIDMNSDLYKSISKSIPENCSVFLSLKRGLIVFEGRLNWNKASIKEVFIDGKHKIQFTKLRHFSYGPFSGFYSKNKMILHDKNLSPKIQNTGFSFDKKASYNVISIHNNVRTVRDYYKKKNVTICYQNTAIQFDKGINQNDKDLFSRIISDDFNEYTFYEKNYLSQKDDTFKNSPIRNWTSSGMTILKKGGESIAIVELKAGQKSIENLNEIFDLNQNNENFVYYPSLSFSSLCPSSKGYYVTDLQGYSVISGDKMLFDQLTTEMNIGNSLSMNKKKAEQIYSQLPENVVYRHIQGKTKESISISGGRLVKTEIVDKWGIEEVVDSDSRQYFTMNPSEPIESFYAYSGRGNTFLITKSNKWIRYENGIRKWEKVFDKAVMRNPKLMEMSSLEHPAVSILFEDEVLIVDKAGRILNRFSSSGGVHPIRCRLRNKVSFLIPKTTTIEVTDYDGKVLSTYSFSSEIKDMVFFKENNKKHVGVLCEKTLFIINLERKKTVRKIPLDEQYQILKYEENSLIVNLNQTHSINLLGEKTRFSLPAGFQLKTSFINADNVNFVCTNDNELLVLNRKGQFNWKRTVPCTSIDKIFIHQNIGDVLSSQIQIGILDGIENKIVLLDSQGRVIDSIKRHGEKDIQITNYGNQGISITTFLGNYLIQYTKF